MQLSFVYITALLAAVSATPLPQAAQTPAETYSVGTAAGGPGGVPFSDLAMLQGNPIVPTINAIRTRSNERVDQISLQGYLDAPTSPYVSIHGSDKNGYPSGRDLAAGEFINYMELQISTVPEGGQEQVFRLRLRTNLDNWSEVGDPVADLPSVPFSPPAGYTRIVGFTGSAGGSLDKLGPIWA